MPSNANQQQQQELTPAATGNSKYSKQIQKMKDKINKLENEISRLEQNKPKLSFNTINSQTYKNIGFKSKTIAKKFAILTDVKIKDYNNEQDFLKVLKNNIINFQKLGINFDAIKYIDTSSEKVKRNRLIKRDKKNEQIKLKLDSYKSNKKQQDITPYKYEDGLYKFYLKPTKTQLDEVTEHYLQLHQ